MSSKIPKRLRVLKKPRTKLQDFTSVEQELILSLIKHFGKIVLFGSRVKGGYEDDSDLDVGIVNYKNNYHKFLLDKLGKHYGIKIDGVRFETAISHKKILILE